MDIGVIGDAHVRDARAERRAREPPVRKGPQQDYKVAGAFLVGAANNSRIRAAEQSEVDEHVFRVTYQPRLARTRKLPNGGTVINEAPCCGACGEPIADFAMRVKMDKVRNSPWSHLSCREPPTIAREGCTVLSVRVEGVDTLDAADAQTVENWRRGVKPEKDALSARSTRNVTRPPALKRVAICLHQPAP